MQVDVILFDWGGTLARVSRQVETLREGAIKAARLAADLTDREPLDGLIDQVLSAEARAAKDPELREVDVQDLLAGWLRSVGKDVDAERLALAAQTLGRTWVGALDPLPGVLDAVRTLRTRGYRIGLVSNCLIPPDQSREELDREGFLGLLDFLVFSSGVGYRKPSSVIYEEALRQAFPGGRPDDLSRVLFVGDSPILDVITPARMGMRTALVADHAGLWSAEDLAEAQPDLRIDTVAELPALLNSR